jgi:hypothetical protein
MPINVPNYNRKTDRHQFGTLIGIPRNPQSSALNLLDEPRRDVVRRLAQLPDAVTAILEKYPSYFSYVASHVG